jgi:hypothetical protein
MKIRKTAATCLALIFSARAFCLPKESRPTKLSHLKDTNKSAQHFYFYFCYFHPKTPSVARRAMKKDIAKKTRTNYLQEEVTTDGHV